MAIAEIDHAWRRAASTGRMRPLSSMMPLGGGANMRVIIPPGQIHQFRGGTVCSMWIITGS